jgi:protein-S-isoprenylcysteine O-methyltransferase Ste14
MLLRYLPLVGAVLIPTIAVGIRPLMQYLRHGNSGVHLFRAGGAAQKVRDLLLVLLVLALIAQAFVVARRGRPLPATLIAPGDLYDALQAAGAIVMLGGIALFASAQLNLGASWRIGVDDSSKPGLVTSGLYALSRHPIFLGLLVSIAGYAAMIPTLLSLGLLVAAYVGFRVQAGIEEDYLARTYGEAVYRDYGRRVGRFVPWLGRL